MPKIQQKPRRLPLFDRWALVLATGFIVLIVAGVLPRFPL
jgi:hypothetical protein